MAKQIPDPEREALAKELRSLIPRLDSKGLAFLVEQAKIHLYNMKVDELNSAALAAGGASAKTSGVSRGAGTAKQKSGVIRIEGSESGSSFYLYYRNNEVMFSKDEMTRLVKMAGAKGTDIEIRERLYNWFERERADVFSVVPIAGKFDPLLKALVTVLKNNFKIRKD